MALMLSEKSYPNAQAVYQTLIDMSTPNAIRGVPANTVNRLLHNGAGLAQEE